MFQLKIFQKFCYFYLPYEIKTKLSNEVFISHLILSENLLNDTKNDTAQKKMKKSHTGNMPQGYSQF